MRRREVEAELSKLGLDGFTVMQAKHYKIAARYKRKRKMFFFSRTPSCTRALPNFTAEVRRWMRAVGRQAMTDDLTRTEAVESLARKFCAQENEIWEEAAAADRRRWRQEAREAHNARANLVPGWSTNMEAAPKDGTRILTFHPANPDAIIDRARRDNWVINEWHKLKWYRSLPEQPPIAWMPLPAPPKGET